MTGHIRRRGERSWELKFDLGTDPLTGKRLTKYHSFKGTKLEAKAELVRLANAANTGDYVDPSKTTLGEFLDRWERDWAAINVSPKTLERYKELLRLHVRPHLGRTPIQKLQPVNLAELYAKLLREGRRPAGHASDGTPTPAAGLAPRTVGHVHRVIHKALVVGIEWTVMQRNVADVAKPPKVQSTEIEILTEDQVGKVRAGVRGRVIYPLVALGLDTGMRRGELLALRWKDVDLDGARLRVEQSLEQTKGGLRFKSPKTKHGRRGISLPASMVIELRALRLEHQEQRLKLGLGKLPDDALVLGHWTADGSWGPRSPNAVTKEWEATREAAKLPKVSLHALRHTHASQLIAAGVDVLTISRRLGHASPTITLNVYGHLFASGDDRAASVIEAARGRAAATE
jgi:integrase